MNKFLEIVKASWFPWVVSSVVVFILLCVLVFPKSTYIPHDVNNTITSCSCFGSPFSFGTKCLGFAYGCEEEAKTFAQRTCPARSCDELIDTFSVISSQQTFQIVQESNRGTDVILVIDTSNSMDGDKITAAKQAAISLVKEIGESERIAIITFNEGASVAQDFSSNKTQITSAINSIALSGGTKYLPALISAEQLFSSQKLSKKGIIFLSDGIPADSPEDIIEKTRSLQKKGIILFTISFGIDVEENENILSQMSPYRKDEREEGWYQSFRGSEDITEAFFEAWQDIKKIPIISVIPMFNQESFGVDESQDMGFTLRVDDTLITQKPFSDALCIPQVGLELTFTNKNSNQTIVQHLSTTNHIFYLNEALPTGNYSLLAKAHVGQENNLDCVFVGEKKIDSIIVAKEADCMQSSCKETLGLLEDFSLARRHGSFIPRQDDYGKVAIVVDRSESMNRYMFQVLESVSLINDLLNPLDERSLISFSEEAFMLVPFTTNKVSVDAILADGSDGALNPQGTTKLLPALEKMNYLFLHESDSLSLNEGKRVLILLTDGMPYDREGFARISRSAQELIDGGVCTYIFSYGLDILDNKAMNNLFRNIAKYSESHLSCGAYVYSPSAEDISIAIKHMFGGQPTFRYPDETSIELTNSYLVLDDGSLEISARIVSSLTGASLPFSERVSKFVCVDSPEINISLFNKKESFDLLISEQDGLYQAHSDPLVPGRYTLSLSSSLSSQDCVMHDEVEQQIVVLGSDRSRAESFVSILIFVLICLLFLNVSQVKKSLGKEKVKSLEKVSKPSDKH